MSARTGKLFLAASLALAPSLVLAQDHAVPRGGGDGGSHGGGGHPSPGSSSGSGSSSSGGSGTTSYDSGGSGHSTTNAERRHPRAGTGTGGGYYPGYPGYGNPGYYPGWGGYYPGYGGYWWPYGYYGWYGGGGYWGYPGYGGGAYYSSYAPNEGGSIRVLVDPAEARVYVDGYYAGVVDDFDGLFQRLHVAPGRHEITLKLEGYQSHRMRVYVGPDATIKLHYDLRRGTGETFEDLTGGAPPPEREGRRERERDDVESAAPEPPNAPVDERAGRLKLSVQPEDASVYIDGAFRGSGREAGMLRLAPGRHRIEIVRPGYRTAEQEVEVAPGETTPLSVTLERPSL